MWLLSELEWDSAIDLGALQQLNYFEGIELTDDMFMQDTLNDFISDGKKTWRLCNRIMKFLTKTMLNLEITLKIET
jgi:fumarylacetoacetase